MNTRLYFAYGANMGSDDMRIRCPSARAVGPMILNDWELKFYSHATIRPKKGAEVGGVLWDISPDCEERLDGFESFPFYYTKQDWKQNGKEFFFYEMCDQEKYGMPSPSYVRGITNAYSEWGLPLKLLADAVNNK